VNSKTELTWVSEPRDERIGAVAQIGVYLAGVLHLPSHLLATGAISTLVKATRGRRNLQIESGEFYRHLLVWPEQEAVDPALSVCCRIELVVEELDVPRADDRAQELFILRGELNTPVGESSIKVTCLLVARTKDQFQSLGVARQSAKQPVMKADFSNEPLRSRGQRRHKGSDVGFVFARYAIGFLIRHVTLVPCWRKEFQRSSVEMICRMTNGNPGRRHAPSARGAFSIHDPNARSSAVNRFVKRMTEKPSSL
jgi:hypothetical protein